MIRHTVAFTLKNQKKSMEGLDFFTALKKLASIPGVQKFECLKQISRKNKFDFGLSMEFDNATLYEEYTNHPTHVYFVETYWLTEVDDFLEIDYEPLT
ncbi:Dabb family protein [Spirosoma flavum]|uniref:Dabb family protein n=1 Tax=Spirosoma flavum TaxID=2048557 RepID=A0ABW6AEQ6_9BACT